MNRLLGAGLLAFVMTLLAAGSSWAQVTRYVRYAHEGTVAYGIQDGDTIRELDSSFLEGGRPTGRSVELSAVRLLAPVEPRQIIATGYNYVSHLGDREKAEYPGLFLKLPGSVVGPGDDILYYADARDLHYEAELVVVIGRQARNVSREEARHVIFGVTAGNDVSERYWQQNDLQWFRAKASDTFSPIGPAVVAGLDYNDLLVESRLNGEVMQSQRTRDLIFDVDHLVSYISRYATLFPGDLIFTGTPQNTSAMKPGDVIEIHVEGVGTLRNQVARPAGSN